MKNKNFAYLIKYEIINTLSNFFAPFFGILFPILMGSFLSFTITSNVPVEQKALLTTNIILSIAMVIPLSLMLVSFPAAFTQEIDNKTLFRLELFGYSMKVSILAKIIVHYLLLTVSLLLYGIVMFLTQDIILPAASSLIVYVISIYLLATVLFIFSYSIAMIIKKFGITYAITMALFFVFMGLSGMMGAQPNQLPGIAKTIAFSLPTAYIATDFVAFWEKGIGAYNFAPFIQSFIFIGSIAIILYIISWYKNRRIV